MNENRNLENGDIFLLKIKEQDKILKIGGFKLVKILNENIIQQNLDIEKKIKEIYSISGEGVFVNSNNEELFLTKALSNSVAEYILSFSNGSNLSGKFYITQYQRNSNFDQEELFLISIESCGEIIFDEVKNDN